MALPAPAALAPGGAQRARFEALLTEHRRIVLKVASTYCASAEDRRDLAQDISAQLWRAFPRYDPQRSFSTWMYRIALNVAISWVRSTRHRSRNTAPAGEGVLEALPAQGPPEDDERVHALRQLIAQLDDLNRALLLLYLEERSYREIAEVLGITETNVATKLSRLKQRIREGLTPRPTP